MGLDQAGQVLNLETLWLQRLYTLEAAHSLYSTSWLFLWWKWLFHHSPDVLLSIQPVMPQLVSVLSFFLSFITLLSQAKDFYIYHYWFSRNSCWLIPPTWLGPFGWQLCCWAEPVPSGLASLQEGDSVVSLKLLRKTLTGQVSGQGLLLFDFLPSSRQNTTD